MKTITDNYAWQLWAKIILSYDDRPTILVYNLFLFHYQLRASGGSSAGCDCNSNRANGASIGVALPYQHGTPFGNTMGMSTTTNGKVFKRSNIEELTEGIKKGKGPSKMICQHFQGSQREREREERELCGERESYQWHTSLVKRMFVRALKVELQMGVWTKLIL